MTYDTLVTGGTLVTPEATFEATLAVSNGRIAGVLAPDTEAAADRVVDVSGRHVLPGGVDPHVHMMDPGDTDREDFPTGTAAAAVGGITTIGEHHRTDPTVLTAEILTDKADYLGDRARVDFALLAGGHPDNIDEITALEEAGAIAYKSFTCNVHGVPALHSADMHRLFTEVERVGGISMVHPEDELMLEANERGLKEAGRTGGEALPDWRSKEAEQVAVATTLRIARQTNVPLWLAHLTHPTVVDQVSRAKADGLEVYAETCPQYLYLTSEDVVEDAPYTTFTPPARSEADRDGLWDLLAGGEIDMVNADHAPSTREQKAEGKENIFGVPFGIPGVETVLPLLLNGVAMERISLSRVVEVFSTNPAHIMGLYPRKGTLRVGADADFVVVDLDREWTLRDEDIIAKCGWTPFDGHSVTGRPEGTYVRGEPVVEDRQVVAEPGHGTFVTR